MPEMPPHLMISQAKVLACHTTRLFQPRLQLQWFLRVTLPLKRREQHIYRRTQSPTQHQFSRRELSAVMGGSAVMKQH
jgi:hypothetical protein